MGKNDNQSQNESKNDSQNNSKDETKSLIKKLEEKLSSVTNKIIKLENQNAVLTDIVESKPDPTEKPHIIRRGYVKPGVGFIKNKDKIPATIAKEKPDTEK